jgi:bacteriophage N4 adsorption protein A
LFEDSKRWQAYSQINANGSNLDPVAQQSVELGLSYRLLEDVNVLASAGAIYFSDGEQRLLPFIRLSGDFLNQDDWRNGWRFENSWWERQWYNDILYFTDNEQIFAISRFDGGYVWPLSTETKQTVKFYGLVQFDYRKQPISTKELKAFDQTSIGMGIQWRLFDTPSSKNQSASVWSASLELRNRVLGDLTNDDVGVFITIGYKY